MLWIFHTKPAMSGHVNEVTVQGKKIEGIMGNDSWTKTLGKYDSSDRAAEILQDIVKTVEENQVHLLHTECSAVKKKQPFHSEKVVLFMRVFW